MLVSTFLHGSDFSMKDEPGNPLNPRRCPLHSRPSGNLSQKMPVKMVNIVYITSTWMSKTYKVSIKKKNTGLFGNFSRGGGGSLIPKSGSKNTTQKVIFL